MTGLHVSGQKPASLAEILSYFKRSKAIPWANPGFMVASPLKAIRLFCLGCMGGDKGMVAMVTKCASMGCFLHPYRMGHNPFYGMTDDEPEEAINEDE